MTTHEAGRELDALIALKVMGWKRERDYFGSIDPKGSFRLSEEIPHYSTDIAAAWTIIEHFYNAGWGAGASMDGHTGCEASIGQFVARADTAPLAICLAALEATP